MNNITILGRLGKDPETTLSKDNKTICKFSVGVTRKFNKEVTDWFNCVSFGKTAEIIQQYFNKGSQIALQGEIQFGDYTDKDGIKRYTTTLVVNSFDFIGNNSNNSGGGNGSQEPASNLGEPVYDEDMPF